MEIELLYRIVKYLINRYDYLKRVLTMKCTIFAIATFLLTIISCTDEKYKNQNYEDGEKLFSGFIPVFMSTLSVNYFLKDSLIQIGNQFPKTCPFSAKTIKALKLNNADYVCEKATVVDNIKLLKEQTTTEKGNFDLIVAVDDSSKLDSSFQDNIIELATKAATTMLIVTPTADDVFQNIQNQLLSKGKKEVVNLSVEPLDVDKSRRDKWKHRYIIFQ